MVGRQLRSVQYRYFARSPHEDKPRDRPSISPRKIFRCFEHIILLICNTTSYAVPHCFAHLGTIYPIQPTGRDCLASHASVPIKKITCRRSSPEHQEQRTRPGLLRKIYSCNTAYVVLRFPNVANICAPIFQANTATDHSDIQIQRKFFSRIRKCTGIFLSARGEYHEYENNYKARPRDSCEQTLR